MSRFDYELSKELTAGDPPFAALIMAAYRKADTRNLFLIEQAWPDLVAELRARYNAPGGVLPGEYPAAPGDLRDQTTRDRVVKERLAASAGEDEWLLNLRAAVDHDHLYKAAEATMTLGQLIDALALVPVVRPVAYRGGGVGGQSPTTLDSWRGVYADLALSHLFPVGDEDALTVGQLLDLLRDAVGTTFTGYKGGDYRMSRDTPVWVDNYGTSEVSGGITEVDDTGSLLQLHVAQGAAS